MTISKAAGQAGGQGGQGGRAGGQEAAGRRQQAGGRGGAGAAGKVGRGQGRAGQGRGRGTSPGPNLCRCVVFYLLHRLLSIKLLRIIPTITLGFKSSELKACATQFCLA